MTGFFILKKKTMERKLLSFVHAAQVIAFSFDLQYQSISNSRTNIWVHLQVDHLQMQPTLRT
jgi:hypothetical protein